MATQTSVLKNEAAEFWDFVVILFFDTLRNLTLLGALSVLFFAVKGLRLIGMRTEYLAAIEGLHFYLTYSVLTWIGLAFFAKMVGRALKK